MHSSESKLYTNRFFSNQQEGSRRSAMKIVPIVMQLVSPRSVLDVGCGVGTWLTVFNDEGATDYLGVDGDYVDRSALLIPQDRFASRDLKESLNLGRTFELACSLEVAEHLPPARAHSFVESLTRHAPVVLFSAAVPQQGGTGHLNERWPSYWAEIFARFEFEVIDCVRRRVWEDPQVEPWYAQNALLFVRRDFLQHTPALLKEREASIGAMPLDVVHPGVLNNTLFHQDFKLRVQLSQPTREQRSLASSLPGWLVQHAREPGDIRTIDSLRGARGMLAATFLEATPAQLPAIFGGPMGDVYRQFMRSQLRYESLAEPERRFVEANLPIARLDWTDPRAGGRFLAASLYRFSHQDPQQFEPTAPPEWLREAFVDFLCEPAVLFKQIGEVDLFARHAGDLFDQIGLFLHAAPNVEIVKRIAEWISSPTYFVNLAHTQSAAADKARQSRASIVEALLKILGHDIELHPGPIAHHDEPRIGILLTTFAARPESLAAVRWLDRMDRERFDLRAYQVHGSGDAMEQRAAECTRALVTLPPELHDRARVIRTDALDVLLIEEELELLAAHRLARMQIVVSPTMDSDEVPAATVVISRGDLGIADDVTLFIATVNPRAITPEIQEEWAAVLKASAKSFLLLAPAPPSWAADFPNNTMLSDLRSRLTAAGIDPSRVGAAPSTLSMDQWLALTRLADRRLVVSRHRSNPNLDDPSIARRIEEIGR